MNRTTPLIAGLALLATTVFAPPARAGNESAVNCGDGRLFTVALKVDRARLKTHKKDRRLVRVIIKNPCAAYAVTGWGHQPVDSDNDRVMIIVGPGVKVDWDADNLARLRISRDFNWSGGTNAGGNLADYRCRRPTHLLTKDSKGRPQLTRYRPDARGCPKA